MTPNTPYNLTPRHSCNSFLCPIPLWNHLKPFIFTLSCVGGGKVESIIHYYHKMGSSLLRNFLQCIGSFENFLSSTSHFLLLCFQYFVFSFICRYHNTIMENWEHMSRLDWTQNRNIFVVFGKTVLVKKMFFFFYACRTIHSF